MTDDEGVTEVPALEAQKIELERYKALLDYRKFIWGSVFAAIVVASIPPSFQLATAYLEKIKADKELAFQEQKFHDAYLKDFLSSGLSTDIELRIRLAEYFSNLASGDSKLDWTKYLSDLKSNKKEVQDGIDEKEAQLAASQLHSDVESAKLKRHLDWLYAETGYLAPNRTLFQNPHADDTSAADLRAVWKPDGITVDSKNVEKIEACIKKLKMEVSIPYILYSGDKEIRKKVLSCLNPPTKTINQLPDAQVAQVKADLEAAGATAVVVTPDGNGTSKVVATFSN